MDKIKMGVVGCGAIAQVHHVPNLMELHELFDVTVVCDVSADAARYVAGRFSVPGQVTDYRDVLDSDVEAVLLCHSDPKTEVAMAAFDAGKHVFIEKPMCYSLQEADRIIGAMRRSGKVGQVGYMKVYDPGYEAAKREVEGMDSIRFIQVNHLHPSNELHTSQFHVKRFADVPEKSVQSLQAAREAVREEAIGRVSPEAQRAFDVLAGSMIHDLYGLRMMLGNPGEVVAAEIWQGGRGITLILRYPNGARCLATWIDLPKLWDFHETLEVYGDDKRVLITYPCGFARGILATVTVHDIGADGTTFRKHPALDWETAFSRELRHFYSCVREAAACRTPLDSARDDIALIIDIIRVYTKQTS